MVGFRAEYPEKAIWTTYFLISAPARLVFMFVYYLPKSFRQHPQWSWRQAVGNATIRMWFVFASTIEFVIPKPIDAGSEKDSWVVIGPAAKEFYCDILDDPEIQPATIGGMWYNTPYVPEKDADEGKRVVLHFHGGAYVLGGCRPNEDGSWSPANLSKRFNAFVFCPQYRLSTYPNGRFPAVFQVDRPIWISCGSGEALRPDIKLFEEKMKAIPGNVVELVEVKNAPHDIFILGKALG